MILDDTDCIMWRG